MKLSITHNLFISFGHILIFFPAFIFATHSSILRAKFCTFCHLAKSFSLFLLMNNATDKQQSTVHSISLCAKFQLDVAQVENELDYFVWMGQKIVTKIERERERKAVVPFYNVFHLKVDRFQMPAMCNDWMTQTPYNRNEIVILHSGFSLHFA